MATVMIELKRLGDVRAPAGFSDRVLAQVGIADSYAKFETVLGPVYVAWNQLGVSAAMRSKSAAEFEEWFRKDVGRQLVRVEPPRDLAAKIEDQLEGKRRMRFDLRGLTPFSQDVLRKTLEITRGQARPYGWIACEGSTACSATTRPRRGRQATGRARTAGRRWPNRAARRWRLPGRCACADGAIGAGRRRN